MKLNYILKVFSQHWNLFFINENRYLLKLQKFYYFIQNRISRYIHIKIYENIQIKYKNMTTNIRAFLYCI